MFASKSAPLFWPSMRLPATECCNGHSSNQRSTSEAAGAENPLDLYAPLYSITYPVATGQTIIAVRDFHG